MSQSPFKFLNAYQKEDAGIFFGREKETEELYQMTYDTRLMLVVGASGTGKTSLIQCGLANKFDETRWNDIYIRRQTNIMDSINKALDAELVKSGGNFLEKASTLIEKIENIYRATFKPVYLIFDQFEELFIINENDAEEEEFFRFINELINSAIACKVILVMRDEFISHLWKYEDIVPSLFNHRYRIESMRPANMAKVITSTLHTLEEKKVIRVDQEDQIAEAIMDKLFEGKQNLELTYLQVYLDRMYQESAKNGSDLPEFSPNLVNQVGEFEDIIGEFLANQIIELEQKLGPGKKGIPIKILSAMITDEKTKKVLGDDDLKALQQEVNLSKEEFQECIQIFSNMRILKQYD